MDLSSRLTFRTLSIVSALSSLYSTRGRQIHKQANVRFMSGIQTPYSVPALAMTEPLFVILLTNRYAIREEETLKSMIFATYPQSTLTVIVDLMKVCTDEL